MRNELNERKSYALVVAAVVASAVTMLAGLITALCFTVRDKTRAVDPVPQNLLVDAAVDLNHSLSALRLCVEPEPAREVGKTALVFAVRAETALECVNGPWLESRDSEAFLNDVATVLHSEDPLDAVNKSEQMFAIASRFYDHVSSGAEFSYNGELIDQPGGTEDDTPATDGMIEEAKEFLIGKLDADKATFIGAYDGRIEFDLERDGVSGYGVVKDGRIIEFSFAHSGSGTGDDLDREKTIAIALDCAKLCGFDGLEVFNTDINHDYGVVQLCRKIDGAMACDECANVAVVGETAVAFTAGKCEAEHDVPTVKVDERSARKAAPDAKGEGMLVTRTVNGKERVCYEYRYDLEDGVHFVYVCAENGKQMQVR